MARWRYIFIGLVAAWVVGFPSQTMAQFSADNGQGFSYCGTRVPRDFTADFMPGGRAFEDLLSQKSGLTDTTVLVFPVVFHVIHNGEAVGTGTNVSVERIDSQIRILNEDFRKMRGTRGDNSDPRGADARIEFRRANRDPSGQVTDGINRVQGPQAAYSLSDQGIFKNLSKWPADRYLNVWVCQQTSLLGFAQFPVANIDGIPTDPVIDSLDGVVVTPRALGASGFSNRPYHLGRTLTHELGHFFGLLHPWGEGGSCTISDYVDDTPAQSGPISGCPSLVNQCGTTPPSMVPNYLNFTNDSCMNVFTIGQVERMHRVLAIAPRRLSIVSGGGYVTSTSPEIANHVITVFPNPTEYKRVFIQVNAPFEEIQCYDIRGKLVKSVLNDGQGYVGKALELTFAEAGLYLINCQSAGKRFVQKVLVK